MHSSHSEEHALPSRREAGWFFLKSRLFIARRWLEDRRRPLVRHVSSKTLEDSPISIEVRSPLWTQVTEAEFPLTAGKVQNLRAACHRLHGVEIPAGAIFSFWRQVGRTTASAGYVDGRELRSGCLVPNRGGGLCQLSGLLYEAALKSGLEVLERHAHSRSLPGAELVPERDATVFWNYVDLRFRAPFAWRIECQLSATHLVVRFRKGAAVEGSAPVVSPVSLGAPVRASADGDCLTCGVVSCFRHPSAVQRHAAQTGHTAWVLDGCWPEFQKWCREHAHSGDRWLTPLDGHRWKKPNYAWDIPSDQPRWHATRETLLRSWAQRRLPTQGAVRQRFLLKAQQRLAEAFAAHLDPKARHVVVSQTLLPFLWEAGHLGGRTFDVLMQRWPLHELQRRLDQAAELHPESDTLADFRADERWVEAEREALAAAARVITPHRAIAAAFGSRALLLDWVTPVPLNRQPSKEPLVWYFPASALGRKGIHELASALQDLPGELAVLGGASEGENPLKGLSFHRASPAELASATALVLPAFVEHEPRFALRALASGIPVVATRVCGLPSHPLLTVIEAGDVEALRAALHALISQSSVSCIAS